MRVLRFLRPGRSAASAAEAEASDGLGLDAFATEAPPPAGTPVPPATMRLRAAVAVLGVLTLVQVVPSVLWVQERLAGKEPTVLAATPIATPLPATFEAAPPCAPAPAESAAAPAAAAAASRPEDSAGAARAAAPALVAGLVAIDAPVPMHVYARGRIVGTTEAETIMLPVGTHELELVSDEVGFRAKRSVTVTAGRTSTLRLDAPRVPIHVNAIPWAEVWIDNQRVGETPIGNLPQTIGPHEVVFRHPELGERRTTVVVTMKEPARVSMDLRKR